VTIAGAVLRNPYSGASALVSHTDISAHESTEAFDVELEIPDRVELTFRGETAVGEQAVDLRVELYAWWPGVTGTYAERSMNIAAGTQAGVSILPYSPRFGLAVHTVHGKRVFDRKFENSPGKIIVDIPDQHKIQIRIVDSAGVALNANVELEGETSGSLIAVSKPDPSSGWVEFTDLNEDTIAYCVLENGERVLIGKFSRGSLARELQFHSVTNTFTKLR